MIWHRTPGSRQMAPWMGLHSQLVIIPVAIVLGASLCHCSYDVVFSRAFTETDSQAGAAGRGNASEPGGGASASTTRSATAGAPEIPSFPPGISWQWQLVGTIAPLVPADLYTVDLTDCNGERNCCHRVVHFPSKSRLWHSRARCCAICLQLTRCSYFCCACTDRCSREATS